MATKKRSAKKVSGSSGRASTERPEGRPVRDAPRSMPKGGKDPKGGLTAKGREYFKKKEGSHLRPGVQGPADTPEKMVRKGSFLRRHFTHPRGPMKDAKGEPTRLALSAHARGEPVPDTLGEARKLAGKGHELLERYHEIKDGKGATPRGRATKKGAKGRASTTKAASGKTVPKQIVRAMSPAAKKAAARKIVAKTARKGVAKKAAGRGSRGPGG